VFDEEPEDEPLLRVLLEGVDELPEPLLEPENTSLRKLPASLPLFL
jgi:hypothetical protein